MHLQTHRLHIVGSIGSPCKVREIELDLIPSLIKPHWHCANKRFHSCTRLWFFSKKEANAPKICNLWEISQFSAKLVLSAQALPSTQNWHYIYADEAFKISILWNTADLICNTGNVINPRINTLIANTSFNRNLNVSQIRALGFQWHFHYQIHSLVHISK
jgi:hypothetical protein